MKFMRAREHHSRTRTLLLACLALPILVPLLRPAPAGAADREVSKQVAILKRHAREPFEQREREKAIRALGDLGGPEAAAALLPIFDDPYEHLADHAVSAWIRMVKGEHAAATNDFLVNRALSDRRAAVRRGAAVALGFSREDGISEALQKAVSREKNAVVLAALADTAIRRKDQADFTGVFGGKLRGKDGAMVAAAARALGEIEGTGAVEALVKLLDHRQPLARAAAIGALQRLDSLPPDRISAIISDQADEPEIALLETLDLSTAALPFPGRGWVALKALLGSHSWRVRAAAIQGALRIWRNGIVDLLIDRLGIEEGRLVDDIRAALMTYTGQSLGNDQELWRAWWEGREATFKPGARPKPLRSGRIPFREGAGDPEAGDDSVAFFNLPLRSTRIAFVFDLSGSMREPAVKGDDSKSKLDLLREKFAETVGKLPKGTVFDLFVYRYLSDHPPSPRLTRAFGKLRPATRKSATRASEWLKKQEAKGWGAFVEPLTAALETEADTVILLSDGSPSRGILDRDFRILMEFPKRNRFRQVAVHTILIGTKGTDRDFMRNLAAETGGRFSQVR